MDELIRKQDALDALMAERKHLLAKGQKGAEHVLTHHGYNVIDELPPVQSDVPVINVGDMISRQAAIEILMNQNVIMDGSEYHNGFNAGVNRAQEVIRKLPPVQPKRGHWMIEPTEEPEYCKCSECGYVNLIVEVFAFDGYHYCPNCGADMREVRKDGAD